MKRVDGEKVDVGESWITMKLDWFIHHRKTQLAVFLLGLVQLHPLGQGSEPVVVEEIQLVAPQWPLGPPAGRAPGELSLLVLPCPVAQKTRKGAGMILLAWKTIRQLKFRKDSIIF